MRELRWQKKIKKKYAKNMNQKRKSRKFLLKNKIFSVKKTYK